MTLSLYQVDAFTDKLFGGNPAAVIPLKDWLNEELMQQLALENNLSETVFFVPSSADGIDYEIRWFLVYMIEQVLRLHFSHLNHLVRDIEIDIGILNQAIVRDHRNALAVSSLND